MAAEVCGWRQAMHHFYSRYFYSRCCRGGQQGDWVRCVLVACVLSAWILIHPSYADDEADSIASGVVVSPALVRSVVEATLAHHVDPPTRQQVIVNLLRYVSGKLGPSVPRELSAEVSTMSNVDELYKYAESKLDECDFFAANNNAELLIGGLQQSFGEAIRLVPRKEQLVNEQIAANRYVGIGIQVTLANTGMRVTTVFPGGTSEAAGMKAGDVIESIDGVEATNVPLATLIERLRGAEGTFTLVGVRNAESGDLREMKIERKVVPFKTVEEMQTDKWPDNFRRFKVLRITASTVNDLAALIDDLPDSVDSIVLDLSSAGCSATSIGLHNVHLFADALLDDATLGKLESRTSSRTLRSEPDNILRGRQFIVVYKPTFNTFVDWLAITLHSCGQLVYYEGDFGDLRGFALGDLSTPIFTEGFGVLDSVEVNDDYFVELTKMRLKLRDEAVGKRGFGQRVTDFESLIRKPKSIESP